MVSNRDKKLSLESAIYSLVTTQPFYGSMLQCIDIYYDSRVPTAGIMYDKKSESYKIYINADFFCPLPLEQRVGILQHEVLHFSNKHLFRLPFLDVTTEEAQRYNVAGDMAINQYISHLPDGGINVKEWKLDNGDPFPLFRSMEEYEKLIKENKKNNKQAGKKTIDEHNWEKLTEEEKEEMLKQAEKLVKRAKEKCSNSFSKVPESIEDLLQEIEALKQGVNYKQILRSAIKRSLSVSDREHKWNKPNKRYGNYAPGTVNGTLPALSIYCDTSGSISINEMNDFMNVLQGFLKVGAHTCQLGFWHTVLYRKKKHKKNSQISQSEIQSGGTDVDCVLEDIKKSKPNLSIILTDLFFDVPKSFPKEQIVWVVSRGGNKDSSFLKGQKVVYLDKL